MNEVQEFWERLNSLIKKSNTTQSEVSVQCGFNPRRLQNLSAGCRLPDAIEVVKIATYLHTTAEYLVTGENTVKVDNSQSIALLQQVIKNLS